ncbi:hypothetical protein B0T12DRAFT_417777 [Alternaria alternata]|jgi:hypothetical protein|nr:hypothetical protein B0T12DRAFT_417777 [Alternaria alternata]
MAARTAKCSISLLFRPAWMLGRAATPRNLVAQQRRNAQQLGGGLDHERSRAELRLITANVGRTRQCSKLT